MREPPIRSVADIRLPSPAAHPDGNVGTRHLLNVLRRAALPALLITLLSFMVTALVLSGQPRTYEAAASVVATGQDRGNGLVTSTLVAAPPLPRGAVESALHGPDIVRDVTRRLRASPLSTEVVDRIARDLNAELAAGEFRRLSVQARLDGRDQGVYELRARAETPEAARLLADAATRALIAWDTDRARWGVRRAQQSLRARLADLDTRLARAAPAERPPLRSDRDDVARSLGQVAVLGSAAIGTLSVVASPVAPSRAVAPRPLRGAVLVAAVVLTFVCGVALVLDAVRRPIGGPDDLLGYGPPLLGQLPYLRSRQWRHGVVSAVNDGALYESTSFLRLAVLSVLSGRARARVVVTSARAAEGKSSVTAALAVSLTRSGLRVLVIDADLHRPTQTRLWTPDPTRLRPLAGAHEHATPATTVADAARHPERAHALYAAPGVDLLPGHDHGRQDANLLTRPDVLSLIDRWSEGYDVTLIDTPPVLALADAFVLAAHADGLLLVTEAGRTFAGDVEHVLRAAAVARARVLGFVLNKLPVHDRSAYTYGDPTTARDRPGGSRTSRPT